MDAEQITEQITEAEVEAEDLAEEFGLTVSGVAYYAPAV